jgi:hypothetical protein
MDEPTLSDVRRPIKTAPRDGSVIMIWRSDPREWVAGRWRGGLRLGGWAELASERWINDAVDWLPLERIAEPASPLEIRDAIFEHIRAGDPDAG